MGCQSSDVPETDEAGVPATTTEMDHDGINQDGHEVDGHDHSAHTEQHGAEASPAAASDMDKMMEALADLPEEDRKSAMKQHFCPVSGEMLGLMGAPEKIEVKGQTVWICCDDCKDKLLADSDTCLAKLNK